MASGQWQLALWLPAPHSLPLCAWQQPNFCKTWIQHASFAFPSLLLLLLIICYCHTICWKRGGDVLCTECVFYFHKCNGKWRGWTHLGFLCTFYNLILPLFFVELYITLKLLRRDYKHSIGNNLSAPFIGGAGSFLLCCLEVSIVCIWKQHKHITQLHYGKRGKISPMYFWILHNVLAPGLFAFDPVSLSGEHMEPRSSLQQWELIFCSQYLKSSKKIRERERDRQMGRGKKKFENYYGCHH